jgi:hypothetical protein
MANNDEHDNDEQITEQIFNLLQKISQKSPKSQQKFVEKFKSFCHDDNNKCEEIIPKSILRKISKTSKNKPRKNTGVRGKTKKVRFS